MTSIGTWGQKKSDMGELEARRNWGDGRAAGKDAAQKKNEGKSQDTEEKEGGTNTAT